MSGWRRGSSAKMCEVELPFNLYCIVNICPKFTASIKEKYVLVVNKTIFMISIPENLLHLLISLVQNLTSTFSICREFSAETCFVYMTPTAKFGKLCTCWHQNFVKCIHVLVSNWDYKCQKIWCQTCESLTVNVTTHKSCNPRVPGLGLLKERKLN